MISVVQLGTLDYATGLRLQQSLVDLRKQEGIGDTLLLLEHSPVITLGRNASRNNLLASQELLAEKGVPLFDCVRGAEAPSPAPGQRVSNPIFYLGGSHPKRGEVG